MRSSAVFRFPLLSQRHLVNAINGRRSHVRTDLRYVTRAQGQGATAGSGTKGALVARLAHDLAPWHAPDRPLAIRPQSLAALRASACVRVPDTGRGA